MKRYSLLFICLLAALQACSSIDEGSTIISGKVTDARTGKAISGVQVSDGVEIVTTDARGRYSFSSDNSVARNVFVIMPSEYDFTVNEWGGWADYQPIDTSSVRQKADFKLTPRDKASERCRFLLLGDPQQMSSRPHSGVSWKYVCDAIREYRRGVEGPLYVVSLGDMVTNEIEEEGKAEAYLEVQKTYGLCTFCTPGNHDHIQKAPTYYDSVEGFSKWFGPYNYSFNVGGTHFIFLDSCAWRETPDVKLTEGLNEQAISFLEKDLTFVDKDTPVLIFTHCPMTKKHGGRFADDQLNFERFIKALEGREVNCWYGHIHFNTNYSYTPEELDGHAPGVKSLDSHIVTRCGGCWACSGEVSRDGSPRGFVELDIEGKDQHWQFHSIDANYDSVMNVCVPGQFRGENLPEIKEDALYCNVYMWDNLWSTPEIWIDGIKAADMTKSVSDSYDATIDPLYAHFYNIWKKEGRMVPRDEPARVYDNCHLFEYLPANGVRDVEIRVTDRWGGSWSKEVRW